MYDLIGDDDDGGGEELLGYDDIVGDDSEGGGEFDDVGAVIRRATSAIARTGQRPTMKRVLKRIATENARRADVGAGIDRIRMRNAIGVVPRRFDRPMVIPAPFASVGLVAAGATAQVVIQSPLVWKPERLFVPAAIATAFTLDVLQVALQSWILTAQPIPCEMFTEDATDQLFRLDTLQIGQQLVMAFTNRSGAAVQLRGAWKGTVIT